MELGAQLSHRTREGAPYVGENEPQFLSAPQVAHHLQIRHPPFLHHLRHHHRHPRHGHFIVPSFQKRDTDAETLK